MILCKFLVKLLGQLVSYFVVVIKVLDQDWESLPFQNNGSKFKSILSYGKSLGNNESVTLSQSNLSNQIVTR